MGRHRKKRPVGDDEYAAMLQRMIRAYGKRISEDPAGSLPHLQEVNQALTDAANLGIYTANKVGGHSINELAGILGVSKQAIFKRVTAGERVARERDKANRAHVRGLRRAAPRELER